MRHHPTGPTWHSHGLYKNCDCKDSSCGCPKTQRKGAIDNVYYSMNLKADVSILEDTISDHSPLFVQLKISTFSTLLKTIWQRDLSRITCSGYEAALESVDWSPIYSMTDLDKATEFLTNNVLHTLDKVAPLKPIRFPPDKAQLSLKRDTLKVMALRDAARKSNERGKFKHLRNKANKLVKRDKILSVLKRLNENPGPKQTWQEAKSILGKGPGANRLPLVTTNTSSSKDHQKSPQY